MESIWQLVERVIVPVFTYGAEGWDPSKAEYDKTAQPRLQTAIPSEKTKGCSVPLVEGKNTRAYSRQVQDK